MTKKPSKKKGVKKFIKHKAGRGGWSEWVYPTKDYLFKCCDCGLVHHMQFKTFIERNKKGKSFVVVPLPKEIRPTFRARRFPNYSIHFVLKDKSKPLSN